MQGYFYWIMDKEWDELSTKASDHFCWEHRVQLLAAQTPPARTNLYHMALLLWRQAFRKPNSAPQTPFESGIKRDESKLKPPVKLHSHFPSRSPCCSSNIEEQSVNIWKNDLIVILQIFPSSLRAQRCLQRNTRWVWSAVATSFHIHRHLFHSQLSLFIGLKYKTNALVEPLYTHTGSF